MAAASAQLHSTSALLRQRIRAVFKHVPKGLAGEAESIHQMRVAGRRLRVALPLLARKAQGKRVQRSLGILRELTRTAGASRDLDVSLDLFAERRKPLGEGTAELTVLWRRLRTARARSRTRMAEALMDLEIARLRRDLRAIVARTGDELFTVFVRLREMRESEGAALVEGFLTLGDQFDPAALHRLRRQARRLRYAAEVAVALRAEPSEAPALFKGLQEEIGQIHDRNVLAAWFEAQARTSRIRGQASLAEEAEAQKAFFLGAARELHGVLLARNPVAAAREALEVMGPARSVA